MFSVRPRLVRWVAVIGALVVPIVIAPVGLAEPQAPPESTPTMLADLSGPVAAALGISTEEAARRLDAHAEQAGTVEQLVRAAGEGYAGEYFDGDALVVSVTDGAAADRVRAAGATPRMVQRSWAELTGIRDALDRHAGATGTAWGIDPQANRVVVTIGGNADTTRTDALLATAEEFGDAVVVEYTDAVIDGTSALLGGYPIYPGPTTSSRCSAGFNATNGSINYLYTAGHCTRGTSEWYNFDRTRIGPTADTRYPSTDWGVVRNDNATPIPGVYAWDQAGSYYQVSTARDSVVGESTCKSGSTTGLTCGRVLRKGITANYGDGPVFGLDETDICARQGDSGGSHFTSFTALGLTSGGNLIGGQCTSPPRTFFQPMIPALSPYVLRIYTGNAATFVGQSVPTTMSPGQTYSVSVTMRNSGSSHWFPGRHQLGSQNPQDNTTWGLNRVNVPAQIAPGGTATFTFTVRAPATPGTYNFQWRMVENGVEWFGAASPNVAVNVPSPATPVQGQVESIDRYGVVSGWARDPGAPNTAIDVRISIDGGHVATVRADQPHPSAGNHGFRFVIPRQWFDGQQHTLVATGVDVTGDPNAQLGQPVPFTLRRPAAIADFDGDFRGDISVWRGSEGVWYSIPSGTPGGFAAVPWGLPGDRIVPGDYDNDRVTDYAVFRPDTQTWWIRRSSDGAMYSRPFGLASDETVPRDYDGDGTTDIAVWRESDGTWYISPTGGGGYYGVPFGQAGDRPVPADYDGDGKADVAVWRPASGTWIVLRSSDGQVTFQQWGQQGDRPVPADYDGDGRTDSAVYRPAEGTWYVLRSLDGATSAVPWGLGTDVLAPADYDGDGDTDFAVWRPADGSWWIFGQAGAPVFGSAGDLPVARSYQPAG